MLEGEPLGNMGTTKKSTKLYLELRQNGRPIDPSGWIKS